MSLQTEADDRLSGFSDSDLLVLYNLLSGKAQIGCWTGGKTWPDQVFHKVWIKALRWILQKTFLCFMSDLIWAGLLRKRPSFTFFPAGANITTQKSSNLCVESAEMYPVQRELLTSPLSSPRRSASLCLLRKWVFLPADASCLRTLSGAHPAAASRGSGSAHRSRKKWSF